MKNIISLIGRGLILGGGFGASFGQLLGQSADNKWEVISTMSMVGMVVGLVSVLGIISVRMSSNKALN